MTNTAIVNRIENNEIYLMHIADYGKKEKTEREFWNIKLYDFRAKNPNKLVLFEGDAVEYYIPPSKTIIATFTTLILPLVMFLVTFGILSLAGIESEKIKALISLITMFSSFFINKLFKRLGIKETLPNITSKLEKNQLADAQKACKDCGSCTACN